MAFATASGSQMSDMNVTPLVDVMLVLLIIFMVTVPAMNFTNDINIAPAPPTTKLPPEPLKLRIEAGGTLSLGGQAITLDQLKARFAAEAASSIVAGQVVPELQPALELSIEPEAEYELVAQVMSRAKNANLVKIGFAD